jgi:hypothetical protein
MDAAVPKRDDYRAHAWECLHEAHSSEDRDVKHVFKTLAEWWIFLAHDLERDYRQLQIE